MKKVLEEPFATVQDFRETVPGIDSQVNFADLNSSAVSAKKMVVNIITAAVYREIVSGGETDALSYLRSAVGNATKYKENIFEVLKKRKADGGDIYKYELEGMRRQYIDNYYNAMDSLIADRLLISVLFPDDASPARGIVRYDRGIFQPHRRSRSRLRRQAQIGAGIDGRGSGHLPVRHYRAAGYHPELVR